MRNTSSGDLAHVINPSREAENMVSGHFEISQKLSLSPSVSSITAIRHRIQNYQLHWIFFAEYSKLNDKHKNILKSSRFDFSKYFYVLRNRVVSTAGGIPQEINIIPPPDNVTTYVSGGNGNIDPYNSIQNLSGDFNPLAIRTLTSSILEAKGLVFEDLSNLNSEQIKATFNYAEIQFFSEKLALQNFNTALLQP